MRAFQPFTFIMLGVFGIMVGIFLLILAAAGNIHWAWGVGVIVAFAIFEFVLSDKYIELSHNSLIINNYTHDIIQQYIGEPGCVWARHYEDMTIVSLDGRQTRGNANMSVTPITANPKVRKIAYSLLAIADTSTPDKFELVRTWISKVLGGNVPITESTDTLELRLRYELYEFNDKCSKQLGEFFNPLDSDQQSRFTELLVDFLRDRVPACVSISNVSFSLP